MNKCIKFILGTILDLVINWFWTKEVIEKVNRSSTNLFTQSDKLCRVQSTGVTS